MIQPQQPIRESIEEANEHLAQTRELLETSESYKRKVTLEERRFTLMRLISDVPEDEARLRMLIDQNQEQANNVEMQLSGIHAKEEALSFELEAKKK